jgi:RNA polymerase sigma-70 factor (ECF subfamily)
MTVPVIDLFDKYADGIFTLAARILRDRHAAEDIVGDTFIAVLRNRAPYRGDGPIRAWLYRIAYRQSIAALRKRRDQPVDPTQLPEPASGVMSAESVALAQELATVVDRAIADLDEPLRAAFVLRDVEELSTKEAAEVLGIGESALKMRLARARQALRVSLEQYLD